MPQAYLHLRGGHRDNAGCTSHVCSHYGIPFADNYDSQAVVAGSEHPDLLIYRSGLSRDSVHDYLAVQAASRFYRYQEIKRT